MSVVNGYYCRTCADESLARRNVDPARPKDGPFGRDAPEARAHEAARQAALTGAAAGVASAAPGATRRDRSPPPPGQGLRLDIAV